MDENVCKYWRVKRISCHNAQIRKKAAEQPRKKQNGIIEKKKERKQARIAADNR